MLGLAVEWGVLEFRPRISLLSGERHRDRVVTREEERLYLDQAPEPLRSIATVLVETGLRPEECYSLKWEDISWKHGQHGGLHVRQGKTPAACRLIPMSATVRFILANRWELVQKPTEGWLWPAPTKCGHVNHSSLKKQHARAFLLANAKVKKCNENPGPAVKELRPWVLYSFRHTFLTRLGESGCDAWTLASLAGHSSVAMSSRYVHPSGDAAINAMSRLSGHN